MGSIKKLFKRKPGGTVVGNLLRTGTDLLSKAGIPGLSTAAAIANKIQDGVKLKKSDVGLGGLSSQTPGALRSIGGIGGQMSGSIGVNRHRFSPGGNTLGTPASKGNSPVGKVALAGIAAKLLGLF